MSATDNLSGLDHFECRASGSTTFTTCASTASANAGPDGSYSFQVRGVDRAGNTSVPVEKDWIWDRTPPTLVIAGPPQLPSFSSTTIAQFVFTATDATSGVSHVICSVDGGVPGTCTTTTTFFGPFLDGPHSLIAYAVDNAGNASSPQAYNWTVKVPASGSFQIVGVEGPAGSTDTTPDQYLTGSLSMPTIVWTASTNAASYNVAIYTTTNSSSAVCSASVLASALGQLPTYSFGSGCVLLDGGKYIVNVAAVNAGGTATMANPFAFQADITPPTVTFGTPAISADQKTVTLPFALSDNGSGLQSAICSIYNQKDQPTINNGDCTTQTSITVTNLIDGIHTFTIVATDKAGNVRTANENFTTLLIVCDPLIGVNTSCVQGLQSNLYYMTDVQRQTLPYAYVDQYINTGTQAATLIYMSQVFVPTRSFESGFQAADGSYVTDNYGNKLTEYFALDLRTFYKLGTNETAGYYEFAIISDDGAVIQTMVNGSWVDYINNDGYNSSKLGCDTKGVYLSANSALQMRIKYFQGPKN